MRMQSVLKKLRHPSRKIILLVLGILIVAIFAGFFIYKATKPKERQVAETCSQVVNNAYDLLQKNDPKPSDNSGQKDDAKQKEGVQQSDIAKQAYNHLNNESSRCTQSKDSSVKSQLDVLAYNVALASTAYASGDKVKAYEYASIASKQHDAIPSTQRGQGSNMPQMENTILSLLEKQHIEAIQKDATQ